MKHVSFTFLPGTAGNFFSRCMNLVDGIYCWVDATRTIPESLDEKINMLGYGEVVDMPFGQRNWVTFENKLVFYRNLYDVYSLPESACNIWIGHPTKPSGCVDLDAIAGPDDESYNFYIDPGMHFEWMLMNSLYKNSYHTVEWFLNAEIVRKNTAVHKINLDSILGSWKDCFSEILTVCNIIGFSVSPVEEQAMEKLYSQWKNTILDSESIASFKETIGWKI
jgi:hypothetical protein